MKLIPKANSSDVRDAKNIIKVDNKSDIDDICNLIRLETLKVFDEDDIIDFTVTHPVIFIRINDKHYFRVDLFEDYYSISQDNVSATEAYYAYDVETRENILRIIDKKVN